MKGANSFFWAWSGLGNPSLTGEGLTIYGDEVASAYVSNEAPECCAFEGQRA